MTARFDDQHRKQGAESGQENTPTPGHPGGPPNRQGGHPPSPGAQQEWIPQKLREAIALETLEAARRFGPDPCTRAQAAAHEAGHVIVAHALGLQVEGARLMQRVDRGRRIWLGLNWFSSPSKSRLFSVDVDPQLALQQAALQLAGFAGEETAGLAHDASSIDERRISAEICMQVADVTGEPAPLTLFRLVDFCLTTLATNRASFDRIRYHLFQTRRLTGLEAKAMLQTVAMERIQ